jgi:hypothetical protein
MSGYMRGISLGPNWFWLFSVGVLSLIASTVIVRLDNKSWQVMHILAVVGSRSWDSIVVLLLALVVSSSENRFRQSSLEISANLVVTNTLSEYLPLLDQLLFITFGSFRNTVCIRSLSVFDDILVLVRGRRVLWEIGPVSLCLAKRGILELFAWID